MKTLLKVIKMDFPKQEQNMKTHTPHVQTHTQQLMKLLQPHPT